jgi:hypothetical protein
MVVLPGWSRQWSWKSGGEFPTQKIAYRSIACLHAWLRWLCHHSLLYAPWRHGRQCLRCDALTFSFSVTALPELRGAGAALIPISSVLVTSEVVGSIPGQQIGQFSHDLLLHYIRKGCRCGYKFGYRFFDNFSQVSNTITTGQLFDR